MLVKLHCRDYEEDFGILLPSSSPGKQGSVHLFENGIVRLGKKMKFSQVVEVKALWLEKDARVRCAVADTDEKKKAGLQDYPKLDEDRGLYFPYPGLADVTFHQGSVSYPLDILFLRDGELIHLVRDTKVGGKEHWSCRGCDGVIETNAGFCDENLVDLGDRISLFACSTQDKTDLENEKAGIVHVIATEEDL